MRDGKISEMKTSTRVILKEDKCSSLMGAKVEKI